jgi:hypothetical protein
VADLGQSHILKNKRTALLAQELTITVYLFLLWKESIGVRRGWVCNATANLLFLLIRAGAPCDQLSFKK